MKKKLLRGLVIGLLLFAMTGFANADSVILVDQGSQWQYSVLTTDLWPTWGTVGYSSVNWASLTWQTGNAAFGNPYSLPIIPYGLQIRTWLSNKPSIFRDRLANQ